MPRLRGTGGPGGGSGSATDRFAPRIIVGNELAGDTAPDQAAPFQYILDPGDGSGIEAALAAATFGQDIYIRPGTYDFGSGAVVTPLTIPTFVNVRGAPGSGPNGGGSGTQLVCSAGTANMAQDLFILSTGASLQDVLIQVPAGTGGGLAGVAIVRVPSPAIRIENVTIDMTFSSATGQRNTDFAIASGSAAATCIGDLFDRVQVIMPTVPSTVLAYAAIFLGSFGIDSTTATHLGGPVIRGCDFRGGQVGVAMISVAAGVIEDCTHTGLLCSTFGSLGIMWVCRTSALTLVQGPRISGCRIFGAATSDVNTAQISGITIENDTTAGAVEVFGSLIDNCLVVFSPAVVNAALHGLRVIIGNNGVGQLTRGSISNCVVCNATVVVKVDTETASNTAGTIGAISAWAFSAIVGINIRATTTNPGGIGLEFDIGVVPAQPKIRGMTATGCDFSGAPAACVGIDIDDAGVTDTIIVGCRYTPNGGTGLLNNGTGSQITGNIP